MNLKYKRILLKLSGESLGDGEVGISEERVMNIAKDIAECSRFGIQIAIVVGGGNMWRGREHPTMDHSIADKITFNTLDCSQCNTKIQNICQGAHYTYFVNTEQTYAQQYH